MSTGVEQSEDDGSNVSHEIELISDGDGLAILGEPTAVDQFLASSGLSADSKPLNLAPALGAASSLTQGAAEISANSGRWLKLTKESANVVKTHGLMDTKTPGVKQAMVGKPGDIKQWLQVTSSPGAMLTNPAVLSGAAGIMAQMAMQQQMEAITDYLAVIDEKLDDVLRSQTNQVLAKVDGADLAVKEAMSVRKSVGRVSEINWSKVQHQSGAVLETQAYALRQLTDLTEKLERKTKVGDLADLAEDARGEVKKWLMVLARCLQLHDAMAVLELDRVLDASPDELDRHRLGLKASRSERLELMANHTSDLLARMDMATSVANAKVLLHPTDSPAIVGARNTVAADVHEFRRVLGLESEHDSSEARRWREAAAERVDSARSAGAEGVSAVKRVSGEALGDAKQLRGKVSAKISERRLLRGRRPKESNDGDDQGPEA